MSPNILLEKNVVTRVESSTIPYLPHGLPLYNGRVAYSPRHISESDSPISRSNFLELFGSQSDKGEKDVNACCSNSSHPSDDETGSVHSSNSEDPATMEMFQMDEFSDDEEKKEKEKLSTNNQPSN